MNRFTSKISFIIISFFMFAIIISFALTGFQGFDSSVDVVARVDNTPIRLRDYQFNLNQKLNNYSRIFGGKSLTSQQIRQFKIKEMTLNELVSNTLILNFAESINLTPSRDEVKKYIKEVPSFKTNDKFDVNKYKLLLAQNKFTPSSYEEQVISDLRLRKVSPLISGITNSKEFVKDLLKFKKNAAVATAVEFDRESFTKYLTISKQEISDFLKDEKNNIILESLYKSKSNKYNIAEQTKASHILLRVNSKNKNEVLKQAKELRKKLTTKNFAKIANEQTQDPSGKGKGGSLGWFERGRMVPEFDKVAFSSKPGTISEPILTQFGYHILYVQDRKQAKTIKLSEVKEELSKEHLQKSNRKALTKKIKEISDKITSLLKSNNLKALKDMQKKYDLTLEVNQDLNMYDLMVGSIKLDEKAVISIFSERKTNQFISKDSGAKVTLAYINKFKDENKIKSEIEKALDQELSTQNKKINDYFYQKLVENLEKKANIVTYPKML